jgi:hypothetical protein
MMYVSGQPKVPYRAATPLLRVADRQQVDIVLFEKTVIVVGINVYTHCQYGHALFSHAALHVDHGRKFFHARGTPSSPEI